MKLNGSTDYAIKILLYLQKVNRMTTAREISEGMNIPPKYIAAILKKLRENGYIRSFQGINGGFSLTEKSKDINLYDIIRLMEDELLCTQCATCTPSCLLYRDGETCPVSAAYEAMHTVVAETARSITIRQISTHFSNREFAVYYQPIVSVKTGKVVAAEALVRRIAPDGSIILPKHFIPVLERTGNITRLDRFVAEEVSRFIHKRMDRELSVVPISVNIAQTDFYDPTFMESLTTLLKDPALPKNSIVLELTETTYAQLEQKHAAYIDELCKDGIQLMLDDFGSGYTSFSRLNQYCFKKLKIDRGFVAQLSDNQHVQAAVEAIISMCHKLGIGVVAEGVETQAQLDLLQQMDCDYMQGYYFSTPLSETDFVEYLSLHC